MVEVAICGVKPGKRAAETLSTRLREVEARFKWDATQRSADVLSPYLKRSCRKPYFVNRPQAADLDGAYNRPVVVYTAGAARTIKASEGEQLAKNKTSRCLSIQALCEHWAARKQTGEYNRTPRHRSSTREQLDGPQTA
jgi:hypothetical protein